MERDGCSRQRWLKCLTLETQQQCIAPEKGPTQARGLEAITSLATWKCTSTSISWLIHPLLTDILGKTVLSGKAFVIQERVSAGREVEISDSQVAFDLQICFCLTCAVL